MFESHRFPRQWQRLRRGVGVGLGILLIGFAVATPADEPPQGRGPLPRIRPSDEKTHFVAEGSPRPFVAWGFNYDHDDAGRLIEDYWNTEWETVAADFREMKALGVNVVRVHLQVGRFLEAADRPNEENLKTLGRLVTLAEETGLYLDVTGLGCYHKQDVPAWYAALGEAERWEVQVRFWKEVAQVCRRSDAIFCYDLMNEPVLSGGANKTEWLVGPPLGGKYFVQRITTDARGRSDKEIAKAWVEKLTAAIRSVDDRHMITVGVIPWAQVFKGAKPLFYSPEVGAPLDFASIHFYPKKVPIEESLEILKVYEVGKPLVIEEIFPLEAGLDETEEFIRRSGSHVDGWVSFYWGKTPDESEKKGDLPGAIIAQWLRRFSKLAGAVSN